MSRILMSLYLTDPKHGASILLDSCYQKNNGRFPVLFIKNIIIHNMINILQGKDQYTRYLV
jgi:hypothetical protein